MALHTTARPQPTYFLPRRPGHPTRARMAARPAAVARARHASVTRALTAGAFGVLQLLLVLVFSTVLLLGPAGLGPLR